MRPQTIFRDYEDSRETSSLSIPFAEHSTWIGRFQYSVFCITFRIIMRIEAECSIDLLKHRRMAVCQI